MGGRGTWGTPVLKSFCFLQNAQVFMFALLLLLFVLLLFVLFCSASSAIKSLKAYAAMDVIPSFKGDTQTWTLLNGLVYWYPPPAMLFPCRLLLTIPIRPTNNFCLSIHRVRRPNFSSWNFLSFPFLAYTFCLIVSVSVTIIKCLRTSKRIKEKRMTWAHSFRDFNLLSIQLLWGLW